MFENDELINELENNTIFFWYNGYISQEVMEEFLSILKNKLKIELDIKKIKQLLSIFIEQLQNVINYSSKKKKDEHGKVRFSRGIVCFGQNNRDNSFFIKCGNPIDNEISDTFKEYLEQVSSMNTEELRMFYKEKLNNAKGKLNISGAGLGIIDMARKGDKFEYTIKEINDIYSFYSVKISVEHTNGLGTTGST